MKDISLLIAKFLLKSLSSREKEELVKWKDKSSVHTLFIDTLDKYWETKESKKEKLTEQEAIRLRLSNRMKLDNSVIKKRSFWFYTSRIAAIFLLCLILGSSVFYLTSDNSLLRGSNWIEITTEAGQKSRFTLPDGTNVWLNAKTMIHYSVDKKVRNVNLIGEAYFEVATIPGSTFVVNAGDAAIEVLGTSFNVSHYPYSPFIETSLVTGKVAMSFPGEQHGIHLLPGDKLIYDQETNNYQKITAEVEKDALWRYGVLFFEKEDFASFVNRLETYYAMKIIYDPVQFKDIHYTGALNNLTIFQVFEFIKLTLPIQYTMENFTIHLTRLPDKK